MMTADVNQPFLHQLYERAALLHPHSIAAIFDDGETVDTVTYSGIKSSSLKIAGALRDMGCKDQIVGVYCVCTLQIPALLLGILQASCSFAPLDPQAPLHINSHVISATALQIVLVQATQLKRLLNTIGKTFQVEISCSSKLKEEDFVIIRIHQEKNKDISSGELGLAYVMHTSGTTGLPKVIRVPHECIVTNILHLRDAFNISASDIVFNAATLTFDTSIVEIFLALSQGASVLMLPAAIKLMPKRLMGSLMRNHVTVIQTTPTLIQRFNISLLKTHLFGANTPLRIMAFGGESCPTPAMIHQWCSEGNKTQFFNIYGITEVSCWASLYRIPDEDIHLDMNQRVPIGDPLGDTILEVRNEHGNRVSSGQGTIFIGGTKRVCYLNNEKMLPLSGPVMRDTGDLVEVTKQGLVYLGRHDDQIKRHGKRITLSQIQQSAEMISGVSSCAAVVEDQHILLFCIPDSGNQITPIPQCIAPTDTFHLKFKDVLPSHGVPDRAYWVSELPLTLHGKLDRCALLQVADEINNADDTIVDSRGVQEKLHQLWQALLPHGCIIDNNSNFLQLGGDSFQAVKMAASAELWSRILLPDLVDNLLHGSFQDVLLYVENIVSKRNAVRQEVSKNERSVESASLKETLGEKTQNIPCEFFQEAVTKHDDVRRPTRLKSVVYLCTKCPSCNLAVKSDTAICPNPNYVVTEATDNRQPTHNASLAVLSRHSAGKNSDQLTTSQHPLTRTYTCNIDVDAAPQLTSPDWWYSIRRGSQFNFSGMRNKQNSSCCCFEECTVTAASVNTAEFRDGKCKCIEIVEKWKYNTGKCVDASPLIVRWSSGAVVYIGSHSHRFTAISMETGIALWESTLGDRVESSACLSTCGKFVVVGCYDNYVYFLNSHSGSVYWKYSTQGPVKSSPAADAQSSLVYTGSHDQFLYALNVEDKTCEWRVHCGGGSVFSSPCMYYPTLTVYVGTLAGDLLAICKRSGIQHWRYRCPKPIFSSPVASATGVIVGCADGILYSISHTGDKLWTFQTGAPIFSSPCIISDDQSLMSIQSINSRTDTMYVVFGAHDHCVYCLDKISGELQWKTKLPSQVYSTPFIFESKRLASIRTMNHPTTEKHSAEPIRKRVRLCGEIDQSIANRTGNCDNTEISIVQDQASFRTGTSKSDKQNESCIDCDVATADSTHPTRNSVLTNLIFVAASSTSGVVALLDISTGDSLASYTLPGEVFSSSIVHKNQIIVGCRDDFLYCLDITPANLQG